ncbi:MAG TPA: histidine phosphatase family protein [Actinomycetota bacterium]|jgi:phosphohistidine phosphatase
MRHILLLRHAKSSWDDPALEDRDRPLSPRGRRAADAMAAHVAASAIRPALILASPAKRARQTAKPVANALGDAVEVTIDERLYTFDAGPLADRIRAVDPSVRAVMLVGHNPAMQELALRLASRGDRLHLIREKYPTGALATLELGDDSWKSIGDGDAALIDFVVPRDLV